MDELNESLVLLSTMSPKTNNKNKHPIKKATKLALKKHFRQSANFDKLPQTIRNDSLLLASESTSTASSVSSIGTKENVEVIIIPESDDEIEVGDKVAATLSVSKHQEVSTWVANVNAEHSSLFNDVSLIRGDKTVRNQNVAANSTFVANKTCVRFDELFTKVNDPKSSAKKNVKSKTNIEKKTADTPSKTEVENKYEKLLDDMYGHTWRVNREKVLPKTEPKPRKNLIPKPSATNNLLRTLQSARTQMMIESPWVDKLRGLCDSDTDSENAGKDRNKLCATRLVFDDSDDDDEVKNNNWNKENRKKKDDDRYFGLPEIKNTNDKARRNLLIYDRGTKKKGDDYSSSDECETIVTTKAKSAYINRNLRRETGLLSFLESLSATAPATRCDASALIFRNCYKKYKVELAQKLFKLYNEKVFDNVLAADVPLEWNDRLRGTAGRCHCKKITRSAGQIEYSVRITLATKVLDRADRLRDTLIHEMCHAATFIANKVHDGHGPYWKAWASKAMRTFPELPAIKVCHNYEINTKYTYKCMSCGYSFGRHSKSLNIEQKRCGHCYGKFELLINKTTKHGGVQAVPITPKKEVTGFALFVKQNYADHKTPDRKHKDVMQLLSRKFGELKTQ